MRFVYIFIIMVLSIPASAEYLFLKNGEVLQGKVESETDTRVVFIEEGDKKKVVDRARILRLWYGNLTLKPVYVYLTDGSMVRAVQVGESRTELIFRYTVKTTEEFSISRNEIKFISPEPVAMNLKMRIAILDLTPRDVKPGIATLVSDIIRSEIVNSGNFVVVERSRMSEIFNEQGLNATGAIGKDNEIKLGRLLAAQLILVGEVNGFGDSFYITIRVVNTEQGTSEFSVRKKAQTLKEIDQAAIKTARELSKRIGGQVQAPVARRASVSPAVKLPAGFFDVAGGLSLGVPVADLASLSNFGIGGYVRFLVNPFKGIAAGIEADFVYYFPASSITKNLMMVPISVYAGYRFDLGQFYLRPFISGGISIIMLTQSSLRTGSAPTLSAGLDAGYLINRQLYVEIGIAYRMVIEQPLLMHQLDGRVGVGYRF